MQRQEPEQRQQSQTGQEYDAYRTGYAGDYEAGQWQEHGDGFPANEYQGQKIYPQARQSQGGKSLAILSIIFSSIGFFLTLAGIIISSLMLQYAARRQEWLVGGGIGLTVSILAMLVCIAIFVLSIVWLALRSVRLRRARRRVWY